MKKHYPVHMQLFWHHVLHGSTGTKLIQPGHSAHEALFIRCERERLAFFTLDSAKPIALQFKLKPIKESNYES